MRKKLFIAVALLAASITAHAAKVDGAPAPECDGLKIATGPAGKGYSKVFADIKKACGNVVPVCEVTTSGGLDNLNALSMKDADVGIAQVDTWATMKSGDENVAGLQGVVGLNFNYLHVVTAANGFRVAGEKKFGFLKGDDKTVSIQRFSDLKGQRVALVGSAALLGRQIDRAMGYGMNMVDVDTDAKAFDMVRKGEVAAAMSVSGWPSGSIAPLKQDSGLTLVPFDGPANNPQYVVRPINYKGLGVYNNNALAVPNVLFTRPFKGEKSQDVSKLRQCLTEKLQELQEGNYQPAWNEIKILGNTYDIPKFGGVQTVAGRGRK